MRILYYKLDSSTKSPYSGLHYETHKKRIQNFCLETLRIQNNSVTLTGEKVVGWTVLVLDSDRWRTVVNTMMKLHVL
jgi:hypothetical protein